MTAAEKTSMSTEDMFRITSTLKLAIGPQRLEILVLLAEREMNVGAIHGCMVGIAQPTLSHQLTLLRAGKLVEGERRGRTVVYSLTEAGRRVVQAFSILAGSGTRNR